MKKLIIVLLFPIITACQFPQKFPDVPKEINEPCPDLMLVKENEQKLSEVLHTVTKNYGEYHKCRAKVQEWIEWHKQQKQNFKETVK